MASPEATTDEARHLVAAKILLGTVPPTDQEQTLVEQHYPVYAALGEADRLALREAFRAQVDLGVGGRYDEILAALTTAGDRFDVRSDFLKLAADCIRYASGPSPLTRSQTPRPDKAERGPASLNNAEARIAEDLVSIIDMASRVLNADPGSHYQWDKSRQLAEAAGRLRRRLGDDDYTPPAEPVDPAKVEAAVARDSQHYAIGKAVYRTAGEPSAASPSFDH